MIELPENVPDLRRLRLFYAGILCLFGVIVARLWYLQIAKGAELAAEAASQRTRLIRRVSARGIIVDAKGRLLATNRSHFVVSVLPDELKKNPEVLPRLAHLLQTSEEELAKLVSQNRPTPFDPVPVAQDVDIPTLSRIEEQRMDLPGVLLSEDPKRDYVDNQTCTHVLGVARPISAVKLEEKRAEGYRGGDLIGVEGLEASYENVLHGQNGGQRIEVDAKGRMRHVMAEIAPAAGHTLRLTLDRDLQQVACNALQTQLEKGHPGAAVAIDPNDGAVLAFASMPSYDLNRFGTDYAKLLRDPHKPLINRASGSFYPNGSTFKVITAAAGLESGVITPSTPDYCRGYVMKGKWRFNCDKRSGHGRLSLERAIAASCDVYFWHVAERAGQEKLAEVAHRFGLGAPTGIDLPPSVDRKGIVPTPEWKKKRFKNPRAAAWVPGDLLNMAIGQGYVGVTPLQMACYTAALANGGDLLRPQLVREVQDVGENPTTLHRLQREARGTLGLQPEDRNAIVAGMERAMQRGGTAAGSRIPGLSVAGKTGTAEAFIRGKKVNHSLFICFAPVENPRIAIAVMVEGGGHGSEVSAPIARRILMRFFGLDTPPKPNPRRNGRV